MSRWAGKGTRAPDFDWYRDTLIRKLRNAITHLGSDALSSQDKEQYDRGFLAGWQKRDEL